MAKYDDAEAQKAWAGSDAFKKQQKAKADAEIEK